MSCYSKAQEKERVLQVGSLNTNNIIKSSQIRRYHYLTKMSNAYLIYKEDDKYLHASVLYWGIVERSKQ